MKSIIVLGFLGYLLTFNVCSGQTVSVTKLDKFDKEKVSSADGLFYRLPATRYKIVITGKHIVDKPSKLLKDSVYLQQHLSYPIPFVKTKRDQKIIESIKIIPETVADESSLYFVKMGASGPFKKVDFVFKTDPSLIPVSTEYSSEGNAITLLTTIADVAIDVLVPGVSPKAVAPGAVLAKANYFDQKSTVEIPNEIALKMDGPFKDIETILPAVKNNPKLKEDVLKTLYGVIEQTPSSKDNEKIIPENALSESLSDVFAENKYQFDDKKRSELAEGLFAMWNKSATGITAKTTTTKTIVSPLTKWQDDLIIRYNEIIKQKRDLVGAAKTEDFNEKMNYLAKEEAKIVKELGGSSSVEEFEVSEYWYPNTGSEEWTNKELGDFKVDISLTSKMSIDKAFSERLTDSEKFGFYYRIPHYTNCQFKVKDINAKEIFSDEKRLCIPQLGVVTWLPRMKGSKKNQNFTIDGVTGALLSIAFSKKGVSDDDKKALGDLISSLPDRKHNNTVNARNKQLELLKLNKELQEFGINPNAEIDDLERENKRLAAILEQIKLKKQLESEEKE